jgi:hypothetical protein
MLKAGLSIFECYLIPHRSHAEVERICIAFLSASAIRTQQRVAERRGFHAQGTPEHENPAALTGPVRTFLANRRMSLKNAKWV